MDTSKEYINMCEKAVEIQELKIIRKSKKVTSVPCWQFAKGDFFSSQSGIYVEGGLPSFDNGQYYKLSDFVWLPRQDQLQRMVYEDCVANCEKTTHWELKQFYFELLLDAHKLYAWYQSEGYDYDHLDSMEQLWLAFVMKEKYNKTWNGEDWVVSHQT